MPCSHCGALNPSQARFCRGCGGPLDGVAMPPGPPAAGTGGGAGSWNELPLAESPAPSTLPILPIAACVLILALAGVLWALRPTSSAKSPPLPAAPTEVASVAVVVPSWMGAVVLCHDLSADFGPLTPVSHYRPHDVLHCSVALHDAPARQVVTARWFYGNTALKESRHALAQNQPDGHLAFSLQAPQPWPAGDYRVELAVDGVTVKTVPFQVAP